MGNDTLVGVIGGMGPDATIDFMSKVLEYTPAESDQDHVHMLVDQNPRTGAPEELGGRIVLAAFNVLNYFNGDGVGGGKLVVGGTTGMRKTKGVAELFAGESVLPD